MRLRICILLCIRIFAAYENNARSDRLREMDTMERKIDIVFNSEKESGEKLLQLASGYISETTILFENEKIAAVIQAKGSVEFFNMNDERVADGKVPAVESGKEVYVEVCCQVKENLLILKFPIYQWIDNYPNCDGEHDRWDTKIVGFHTLTLDLLTHSII